VRHHDWQPGPCCSVVTAGLAYSGNGVRHINKVKLRRARLVLGLVTTFGGPTIPVFIQATRSGLLSLAILPCVGAMSTGDGFGHSWKEAAPLILQAYGLL